MRRIAPSCEPASLSTMYHIESIVGDTCIAPTTMVFMVFVVVIGATHRRFG
jgi:hypothetical protein